MAAPDPASVPDVIVLTDVRFAWARSPILDIADFRVRAGERLFIQGPSGSGKSTLLGLIGGVLLPRSGGVAVLGERLEAMRAARRDAFRVAHVGFIFQMFNLIPYLTVLENVLLPARFSPARRARVPGGAAGLASEAARLLAGLGLGRADLLSRAVTELSVGQQQRVAAARALLGAPELLVADEPTSSLDADMKQSFIELIFRECARTRTTVVFVSHDSALGTQFDRTVQMRAINRAA